MAWPEVVLAGFELKGPTVRTSPHSELTLMRGRGWLTMTVGGKNMRHLVWIAEVQDEHSGPRLFEE